MPRPPQHRIELVVSPEQWEAIEQARGDEARATFVKRILFDALEQAPIRAVTRERWKTLYGMLRSVSFGDEVAPWPNDAPPVEGGEDGEARREDKLSVTLGHVGLWALEQAPSATPRESSHPSAGPARAAVSPPPAVPTRTSGKRTYAPRPKGRG